MVGNFTTLKKFDAKRAIWSAAARGRLRTMQTTLKPRTRHRCKSDQINQLGA
jgi:hypothetical protein